MAAFQDLAAETLAFSVERITQDGRLVGEDEVSRRNARVEQLHQVAIRMGVIGDSRVQESIRAHHLMMAFDLCNDIRDGYDANTQQTLIDLTAGRTVLPTRAQLLGVFKDHGVEDLRPETSLLLGKYVEYCRRHLDQDL